MRAVHWFRSDLRLRDNTALAVAAVRADALALVFVLDPILLRGTRVGPPRLRFLAGCLAALGAALARRGQRLVVRRGDPAVVIPRLLAEARAELLTFNRDYSPYARRRDERVRAAAEAMGVRAVDCKDRVVFESADVRTQSGGPFRVYTPFRNAWHRRLRAQPLAAPRRLRLPPAIPGVRARRLATALAGLARATGRDRTVIPPPGEEAARRRLRRFCADGIATYHRERDRPALDATSRLSPYLRLGVVSVRACVGAALAAAGDRRRARGARAWLDELVWREFYHAILRDHPHVLQRAFRPEYARLAWNRDPRAFAAWCAGRTGYPFVDAAMRQLAATGWMHNRARMVVASFLTKDLLLDWRLGERFFMQRLVDGDPASNNGGWQWAASTGTDAQPYFRVFNPVAQGERFDPDGAYVRRHVPELRRVPRAFIHRPWDAPCPPRGYPAPIVDHAARRAEAIRRFEAARARSRRG